MTDNQLEGLPEKGDQEPAQGAQLAQEEQKNTIVIDMGDYDPRLDPNSKDFDPEAYQQAIVAAGGIEAIKEQIQGNLDSLKEVAANAIKRESLYTQFAKGYPGFVQEQSQRIVDNVQSALKSITDIIQSDTYKAIKEGFSAIASYVERNREVFARITNAAQEFTQIAPFLSLELEELQKEAPDLGDMTPSELLGKFFDEEGNPIDGPYREALERAKERAEEKYQHFIEAEGAITAVEQAKEELTRVKYAQTTDLKIITDKLPNVFYSLAAPIGEQQINGQRQMIPLKYEGPRSKKEVTLFYDFVYDEAALQRYGISKRFDDFDFFVMSICDNLYSAGNEIVSLTKIFREMGNENSPSTEQLEQLLNSLLKGMSTLVTIDNKEVMQAWHKGSDGKYQEIVSQVIPAQLGNERFLAGGRIAEGYVRLTAPSPFLRVAKPIGHVTAWDKEILRLYKGRKTKRYYSVLRFLMMQIGWMRNGKGKRSNKITYSALYEYTGDTTARKQQLTRDMMHRLLKEVFTPAGYISAYKENNDSTLGVILNLNENRQQLPQRQ